MEEMLSAVGAVCEMCGIILKLLIANGFTRQEAVTIVGNYLVAMFTNTKHKGEK